VRTALARASWQALGTSVELALSDADALMHARALVERQLDEVDRTCSRFREDSELMRVNASAGRTVRIDPLLAEAVEVALRAAELTDGDVDPTVGIALVLAGYDRDWRLLACPPSAIGRPRVADRSCAMGGPDPRDRSSAMERLVDDQPYTEQSHVDGPRVHATVRAGWEAIELDRDRATLRIPPGMQLDLGATAKAWAADRAAKAVYEATGSGVLVSLGGDISTAGPAPTGGWRVHVTDDHRSAADAPGQTISVADGGLATSSTTVRRWRHEGRTMHHILDPATGSPVREVWRTVSVAAIDCADANIAATAAIVRGERAPEWLTELGLPARLVGHDGHILTVGPWPRDRAPAQVCLLNTESRRGARAH
jgi:thiamine biosynthesis lipoprotein ApbE